MTTDHPVARILVIEDDPTVRQVLGMGLEALGYQALAAASGSEGLASVERDGPHLVLVDLGLPQGPSGLEVVRRLHRDRPDLPVLVVSGTGMIEDAIGAQKAGAWDFLQKPICDLSLLGHAIEKALERARLLAENRRYQEDLQRLVGERTRALEETTQALRESEARFRGICESAMDGVVLLDADGRITYWNPAAEAIFGYPAAEVTGRPLAELLPPPTPGDELAAEWARGRETGEFPRLGRTVEIPARRRDGQEFFLELALSRVRLADCWNAIGVFRDITARKRAADDLERARAAAEAANRAKDEFLTNISHEIRTPMNAILGFAEVLRLTDLTEEQRGLLEVIRSRGQDLLRIINDILDLARLEVEGPALADEPFRLREVLSAVMQVSEPMAGAKGLTLGLDIDPGIPDLLCGDALRVKQVLWNLVANAIKFTERGGVRVEVEPGAAFPDEEAGRLSVRFSVIDSGIGIPADKHGLIFEPFTQADGSISRKHGGVGLGLTICRRLVDRMRGRLWLESEEGTGSRFHVEVAFRVAGAVEAAAGPEARAAGDVAPLPPLRVLVAEDDRASSLLLQSLLRKLGHTVETVDSGAGAVAAVQAGGFDLVLMDVQMPDLNGLEATRAIRRDPAQKDLPIVAVTAHAMAEHEADCLAAGMNGYLSKPFGREQLESVIRRVLPPSRKE
ncbi:MAG: response regulator [Candidatus Riflebacteria bacterium]|nr:response regulator [Candidatus Riflebacteria bacterium]